MSFPAAPLAGRPARPDLTAGREVAGREMAAGAEVAAGREGAAGRQAAARPEGAQVSG